MWCQAVSIAVSWKSPLPLSETQLNMLHIPCGSIQSVNMGDLDPFQKFIVLVTVEIDMFVLFLYNISDCIINVGKC